MKELELIYIQNYLIAVDKNAKIKENDYIYTEQHLPNKPETAITIVSNIDIFVPDKWCKIITHLPLNNAPLLEKVPILPLIPVNEDIEKLAHQTADKIWADDTLPDNGKSFLVNGIFAGFIEGYKAANKNYSEEDLRNSVNMGIDIWMNNMTENSAEILEKDYQKIIQFINQQKYPIAFIAELEKPSDSFGSWVGNFIGNEPKYRTITNQNLLTEMVGIYKYK